MTLARGHRGKATGAARTRRPAPACASRYPAAGRVRGFTLLEMLVVILLIGIAAAAVAVSVSQGLASARVRAASVELAAALRATRAQAIVKGKEQTFDLDTRAASYQAAGGKPVTLPRGMRLSITSAREDRKDDHTGRIRFFPDGSSTGGHIVLQRGERRWQVNVAWLTGAVSVVTS
jgi:general secretion pathway protein H